jgi:RNA polymerase sigma factor (sigma-70 family)
MLLQIGTQTIEYELREDGRELERLLGEIAAGDHQALADLYEKTRTAVYGLALSYVKNAHDAQDVTQDTFVRVWENAWQYQPQGTPMGWLLSIGRNLARMKLRQGTRQVDLEEAEWNAIPEQPVGLTTEDRDLLQNALGTLEEQERRVVILHAITGLKHREIAQLLELPLATVLSKYHRALKKLRVYMKGDDTP